MTILNTKNVKDLIGKKIKWKSPSDAANSKYNGIAIIESTDDEVFKATTISGDDLNFAFLNKTNQGAILSYNYCYSDDDRFIVFEEYEN